MTAPTIQQQSPATGAPMAPGVYLHKRRCMSGLGQQQAAASFATWQRRRKPATPVELARMSLRITAVEANEQFLTLPEAQVLGRVISFDPEVYVQLVDLYLSGPGDDGEYSGLPIPRMCRACGCTWFNPCPGDCELSDGDPPICTTCACIARIGEAA